MKQLRSPILALVFSSILASAGSAEDRTFSLDYSFKFPDTLVVDVMIDTVTPQLPFGAAQVYLAYDPTWLTYGRVDFSAGLFGVWDFNWVYDKLDSGIGNLDHAGTSLSGTFLTGPGLAFRYYLQIDDPYGYWMRDVWMTVCSTRVGDQPKVYNYPPDIPEHLHPEQDDTVYAESLCFRWSETCGPFGDYSLRLVFPSLGSDDTLLVTGIAAESTLVNGMPYYSSPCAWSVEAVDLLGRASGYGPSTQFLYVDTFCCEPPWRGDVNSDGVGPNIADLVHLVAYLFQFGPEPPCMIEANIDGIGSSPIMTDVLALVHYMFNGGPPPAACP